MYHPLKRSIKEPDLFVNIGPMPIVDAAAFKASCRIDAAADRKWFNRHRGIMERKREPSLREKKAFNLAMGSIAIVTKHPSGAQIRAFGKPLKTNCSNK